MGNVSSASGALVVQRPARHLVAVPSGSASQGPTDGTTQGQSNVSMEVGGIRERARDIDLRNVFGNVTRSARVFLETYGKSLDAVYHLRERNNAGYAMLRGFLFLKGSEQIGKIRLLRQKCREDWGNHLLSYVFKNGRSICDPRQVRAYLYRLGENNHAGLREFARILTPCSNRRGDLIPIYRAHLENRVRSLYRNTGEIGSTDSFMLLFAEIAWAADSSVSLLDTLDRVHWDIASKPIDEQGNVVLSTKSAFRIILTCIGEDFCLKATLAFFLFYIAALRPVLQRIDNSFKFSFRGFLRALRGPTPHLKTYERGGKALDKYLLSEEVIQSITPVTTAMFNERDRKHLSDIIQQGVYELRTNTIGADQSISRSDPKDALGLLNGAFDLAREKWKVYIREYRDVRGDSQIEEIELTGERFAGEKKLRYQTRDLVNEACDMMLLEGKTSPPAKSWVNRVLDSVVRFFVRSTRS